MIKIDIKIKAAIVSPATLRCLELDMHKMHETNARNINKDDKIIFFIDASVLLNDKDEVAMQLTPAPRTYIIAICSKSFIKFKLI